MRLHLLFLGLLFLHMMLATNRSDDGVLVAATGLLLLLSDSPNGRGRILKVLIATSTFVLIARPSTALVAFRLCPRDTTCCWCILHGGKIVEGMFLCYNK